MHRLSLLCLFLGITCIAQTTPAPAPSNSAEADFAQAARYRRANENLSAEVVFLGDSILDYWGSREGTWFTYPGWINRGIGGQTTQQMLLRERHDALDLHPKAIVLEGGGNDMRLGFSPVEIRDNFLTMGELAASHGIRVYVAEMTPVCDCVRPLTGPRTVARIRELNDLLAAMCKEKHWELLRFNAPLADANGLMRAELTVDGVHPKSAGYALLAPIVERALAGYRKSR
ncbi:GDSL-type esterase/lipase family protein [Terriglobus albidus]|uniref:GDSL-type esterase/lipase family protein n=1 Tax=Terriglobus albidus TaxID=1592106 RepID=UPI0021E02744|nr:GDSL-type esterase/lipase family protein [Terriglobus albidus]